MTAQRANMLCLASLALLVMASAMYYPQHDLSHDASWYLIATQKFIDGTQLYFDIYEINPPLAFYLTAPSLYISNAFGANPTTAYFLYLISLATISALWCLRLINLAALSTAQTIGFFAAILVVVFILPISEFGQREHFLLIFALPYSIHMAFQNRCSTLKLAEQGALAAFALLGFALKPYFLAIPAAMVLTRLVRHKLLGEIFSPTNWTLGAGLLAYLIFIVVVHPAYVSDVVPTAQLVYASYEADPVVVWARSEIVALGILGLLMIIYRARIDDAALVLTAGAIGGALSYLLQFKGWNYQILPASGFILLASSCALLSHHENKLMPPMKLVLLSLPILFTLGPQIARGPYQQRMPYAFERFVKAPNTNILVLSSNVWASFPFINNVSGNWTSRYPVQWVIPGAYNRLENNDCDPNECAELRKLLSEARVVMTDDFKMYRPDTVFIDERNSKSYFDSDTFEYLPFLKTDERFSLMWRCYRKVGEAHSYSVWQNQCRDKAGNHLVPTPSAP